MEFCREVRSSCMLPSISLLIARGELVVTSQLVNKCSRFRLFCTQIVHEVGTLTMQRRNVLSLSASAFMKLNEIC
jgi:hypothetical protein